MRTTLILVVIVMSLMAGQALGSERYIIPVMATVTTPGNGEREYWAWSPEVMVSNPGSTPTVVHVVAGYPSEPLACLLPCFSGEVTIQPGETASVAGSLSSYAPPVAMVLESDHPIVIEAAEVAFSGGPGVDPPFGGFPRITEEIGVARDWIPGNTAAWIPFVRMGARRRANLFLVNPNNHDITVKYTQTGLEANSQHEVLIAAAMLKVVRLDPEIDYLERSYRIDVSAQEPFYAFASSIDSFNNDAVFRGPVIPEISQGVPPP
jgi:hypothetical protein